MDPNPFPPPARGKRGKRGINPFANNDRNRPGVNWRNHPDFEEEEEHKEEVLPRSYRMEHRIDHTQLEQGRNLHPVNALNDMGASQRMIREMMELEARRGERPTYRKPYPAYIDKIPLSPSFKVPNFTLFNGEDPHASSIEHIGRIQSEVTISDLAAFKQSEDEPAQDFITRFDGMLFGDLADKAFKYEELLRKEQQKRNSSKGTYYKTLSSYVHLVEVESKEDTEGLLGRETAVAEMAKLKYPISCKALTKPPKDQKPLPFTRGFVPNKPTQNKVYSFDLTKEGITAGRLKLVEKPPFVTTDPFLQPQVNMVNLNWPEQKRNKPATEASFSKGRRVRREASQRPKATISAGVVLCSKCKCESELEVIMDRQNQPTPSVFDRIGTSYQQGSVSALSKDRARQKDYLRPAQRNKRMAE
ncbi:unnamed protein product [Prunus armeniaca]